MTKKSSHSLNAENDPCSESVALRNPSEMVILIRPRVSVGPRILMEEVEAPSGFVEKVSGNSSKYTYHLMHRRKSSNIRTILDQVELVLNRRNRYVETERKFYTPSCSSVLITTWTLHFTHRGINRVAICPGIPSSFWCKGQR